MVTKDTIIRDIMFMDPGLVEILLEAGMHCIGCPVSHMETLAEAAVVHGMDADKLIADMNEYLALKNTAE